MKNAKNAWILSSFLGAALFTAPGLLLAFTTIGGTLGIGTSGNGYQRDVRIFNNAADAAANNNTAPDAGFPGALGAAMAVWKGSEAWSSDTSNPTFGGNVNRNFDTDWQGTAPNSSTNGNTVDWTTVNPCGGGVLAFTETPIADGWRIRFCEQHTWSDGPGSPGFGQFDIQGVQAHEYGHGLGLGHTGVNCGACNDTVNGHSTMCSFICSNGVVERTINNDDLAGLTFLYGTIPANKPVISSLSGSTTQGQTLVILGANFASTVNVKFTAGTTQNTGTIPGVVYNVAASPNQVSVIVPATALDGNVLVWEPALNLLSNAFPIDINTNPAPVIDSVSPSNVHAFLGGTVTISGQNLSGTTLVTLTDNAGAVFNPTFTNVDNNTVTFDSPTVTQLGAAAVNVTTGIGTSNDGSFNYIDQFPPFLAAPATHPVGTVLNWDWQGIANDEFHLLVRRNDLVTGPYLECLSGILQTNLIVLMGTNDARGIGHHQRNIPASLAGLTIYSQIVDIDPFFGCNGGSNIVQTVFQ